MDLCFRGDFPRALLAPKAKDSLGCRRAFGDTLRERDLPQWAWRSHRRPAPVFGDDCLFRLRDRLLGIEIKRAEASRLTPSMHQGLERIPVISPGKQRYPLTDQIAAVPLHGHSRLIIAS